MSSAGVKHAMFVNLLTQAANVAVLDYEFGAVTSPERKKVEL